MEKRWRNFQNTYSLGIHPRFALTCLLGPKVTPCLFFRPQFLRICKQEPLQMKHPSSPSGIHDFDFGLQGAVVQKAESNPAFLRMASSAGRPLVAPSPNSHRQWYHAPAPPWRLTDASLSISTASTECYLAEKFSPLLFLRQDLMM